MSTVTFPLKLALGCIIIATIFASIASVGVGEELISDIVNLDFESLFEKASDISNTMKTEGIIGMFKSSIEDSLARILSRAFDPLTDAMRDISFSSY